jgi:hypothetical protein
VDRSQLGKLGARLGDGTEAVVYGLREFRLPGVSEELVFKEYKKPQNSPVALETIIEIRAALPRPERNRLDAISAWPLATVTENGGVRGVVMRRILADYFDVVTLPGTNESKPGIREVQHLFVSPTTAAALGRLVPTADERLAICRDFASALKTLHDAGVVFGDISPKNEIFRINARPMVFFVDCDGFRERAMAGAGQLNTYDWYPPEPGPQTFETDRYKLGLFILRCLSPRAQSSGNVDPSWAEGALDSAGMDLLRRAVGKVPADRPAAEEWFIHLSLLLGEPVGPPSLTGAQLDRTFVCTGEPVTVTWTAVNALTVKASTVDGRDVADAQAGRGSLTVPLYESGFVRLLVTNDLGSDEQVLGPVAVVPAPRMDWPAAPMPEFSVPATDVRPYWPDVLPPPVLDLPGTPPGLALPHLGPTGPGFWPGLLTPGCPLDIVSMLTGGPDIAGAATGNEGTP